MRLSDDPVKKFDSSSSAKPKPQEIIFPDALAGEQGYRVVGKATNEIESCASEDIVVGGFSDTRQVRFRLFRWPAEGDSGLLVVLQYEFLGANHSLACSSIGLLVHLRRNAADWRVTDQYLLNTVHHFSLQRIQLLDLTGDGVDELVIDSDAGGAGTADSSLQVFDLTGGHFEEVLNTMSRMEQEDQAGYTQVLDVNRTRQSNGSLFCVTKTTLFEKGKWLSPQRVTRPCYKRGDGVDAKEIKDRNKLLGPV